MKINNVNHEEFAGIRIYEEGKVLFKSNRSCMDVHKLNEDGTIKNYGSNRVVSFNLENDIKRALKLNLNRKDNFYIKEEIEHDYPTTQYVLYIHASEIEVENLGERIKMQTTDETCYIDTYKLNFKSGYKVEVLHYREVPKDYEFKNNLEKQNHVKVEDGKNAGKHFIKEYVVEQHNEAIVTGDYYVRHEYSDFRLKAQEIADDWENILPNARLSHYDIEKLLKEYDIVKKVSKTE
jgi:hypothetical protein